MWSVAFAQPALRTLSSGPLATLGWTPAQVVVVAVAFLVIPPAVLLVVELVGRRVDRRLGDGFHVAVIAVLGACFLARMIKRTDAEAGKLIAAVIVLGPLVLALAYVRIAAVRSFVSFLAITPALFLASMWISLEPSPVLYAGGHPWGAAAAHTVPVVVVVFDEFPTTSLMDGRGRLDAKRLPHFAALAKDATWFPNAATVADETEAAVPAILTGDTRKAGAPFGEQGNLFTLLARSHDVSDQEPITRLCPPVICPQNRPASFSTRVRGVPKLLLKVSLSQFLPKRAYERLYPPLSIDELASPQLKQAAVRGNIRPRTSKPGFQFMHLPLPHNPWERLPDGRLYDRVLRENVWLPGFGPDPLTGLPTLTNDRLTGNRTVVDQLLQAHLAQVGAADTELGRLMGELKRTGQYDSSLVIVVADHGAAFQPGHSYRKVGADNAAQVLGVPLFVKRPGQRGGGRASPRVVRTVDIAPTVSREAHVPLTWHSDGRALFARRAAEPRRLTVYGVISRKRSSYDPVRLERGRLAVARRQSRLFGADTSLRLFDFGPSRALLGRGVEAARRAGFRAVGAALDNPQALKAVDPTGPVVPDAVGGSLSSGLSGRVLAVAVNGRVAATTRAYPLEGGVRFSALLPPRALRLGRNSVQILAKPPAA